MLILTRGKHGISWRGGSRQAHFHVRESKSRLCGAYGFRRDDEPVPQWGGNLYVSFKQEGWTKACAGVSASYRVGLVSSHRPHARAPVVGDVLRGVMRVLACQMRGSRTRRQEETPKLLSPLRRSDARRLSNLCLCYRTTADTTRRSAALYGFQLRYPLFLPISAIKPRPLARFHPQHRAEIAAQYTLDHFWVWGRMRGVRHRLDRPDRWHANAHPDSSRVGDWGGVRPAMGPAIGFRWERGLLRWVEFES